MGIVKLHDYLNWIKKKISIDIISSSSKLSLPEKIH